MIKIQKFDNKSVLDYSLNLANEYLHSVDYKQRKKIGQFFTPKKNAIFMANCLSLDHNKISLLDPGSGTGILSAAVCEKILHESTSPFSLSIVAYENDKKIQPLLKATLEACYKKLSEKKHKLTYKIESEDFLIKNSHYYQQSGQNYCEKDNGFLFDAVIANPPYFKIGKESLQSLASNEYVFGQPNIYSLFMIMSANMVRPGGDLVLITPRSFCSGYYYRKIREWFIKNTSFKKIHIFESRKRVFCEEKIQQETIIFHTIKQSPAISNAVSISSSFDRKFELKNSFSISNSELIINRKYQSFIRLPSSRLEIAIIDIVDSWTKTLQDLGFNISTGPIVEYRNRESIKQGVFNKDSVPLLLMQNVGDDKIIWPYSETASQQGIEVNEKTLNYLLPIKNYVILRRVTSKEQKRRVCAATFAKDDFKDFKLIGLENHLNYIYKINSSLSIDEMVGLVTLLNSKIIDIYFRVLNGNNQVNATEMRTLPLPELDQIRIIGKHFSRNTITLGYKTDCEIADLLSIDRSLIDEIYNENDHVAILEI